MVRRSPCRSVSSPLLVAGLAVSAGAGAVGVTGDRHHRAVRDDRGQRHDRGQRRRPSRPETTEVPATTDVPVARSRRSSPSRSSGRRSAKDSRRAGSRCRSTTPIPTPARSACTSSATSPTTPTSASARCSSTPAVPGSAGTILAEIGRVHLQPGPPRPASTSSAGIPAAPAQSEPAIDCIDDYDEYFAGTDITPDDEAERQQIIDLAEDFADQCVESSEDFLQFVGTNNTARDMDTIRRALGEDEISYFGFSYGSELGGTWATLFPDTVRAAVLDGAADPNADELEGIAAAGRRVRGDAGDVPRPVQRQPRLRRSTTTATPRGRSTS